MTKRFREMIISFHLKSREIGNVEKMTIFTRDSAGGVYLRMNEFWGAKVNASIYRK